MNSSLPVEEQPCREGAWRCTEPRCPCHSDSDTVDGETIHTPVTVSSESEDSYDSDESGDDYNPAQYFEGTGGYESDASLASEHGNGGGEEDLNHHEESHPRPLTSEQVTTVLDRLAAIEEQLASLKRDDEKFAAKIRSQAKAARKLDNRVIQTIKAAYRTTERLDKKITEVGKKLQDELNPVDRSQQGMQDWVDNLEQQLWGVQEKVRDMQQNHNQNPSGGDLDDMKNSIKELQDQLVEVTENARVAKQEAIRNGAEARRLLEEDLRRARKEKRGLKRKLAEMEGKLERERMRREAAEAKVNDLAKDSPDTHNNNSPPRPHGSSDNLPPCPPRNSYNTYPYFPYAVSEGPVFRRSS